MSEPASVAKRYTKAFVGGVNWKLAFLYVTAAFTLMLAILLFYAMMHEHGGRLLYPRLTSLFFELWFIALLAVPISPGVYGIYREWRGGQ